MKKVYSLLTMAVIAAMSLTMTSCDGDDYWYDPYGWYDHYDDWGWSNNDWNNGWQGGSQNTVNNSKVAKVQAKDGTKKMVSFGDSSRVYPLLKATAVQLNHRR